MIAIAITVGVWAPVQAQGTYSNTGPVVDRIMAAIEGYEKGDWAAYKAAFADSVMFYNNSSDGLTLEQRMEEHMAVYKAFEEIQFLDLVFGEVHNEGET